MRAYTLFTVCSVLALQIVVFALYIFLFGERSFAPGVAKALAGAAPYFSASLNHPQPSVRLLSSLLEQLRFYFDVDLDMRGLKLRPEYSFYRDGEQDARVRALCVADADGRVVVASGAYAPTVGADVSASAPTTAELLRLAQSGVTDPARLVHKDDQEIILGVAPIFDETQTKVIGFLLAWMDASPGWDVVLDMLYENSAQFLLFPLFGLGFGYLTGRHLTRPLSQIAQAAGEWEQGRFEARAPASSADELGALGTRLNLMADELKNQMQLQQQLATLEERNRLARELHDTVKQQLFASAMQISAARRTLAEQPDLAQTYLCESEALTRQMQKELSVIIQKLAPTDQRPLAEELQELAASWARQNGVAASFADHTKQRHYAPVAEHELLRITQEALANIARHSAATEVSLRLSETETGLLRLTITDNGKGFDPGLNSSGLGLQSMRERAQALPEGTFQINSAPRRGTSITITFQPEPRT